MVGSRKPCPSDVIDHEWSLVVPCPTLMIEEAPRGDYLLRELFNGFCQRSRQHSFPAEIGLDHVAVGRG